MHNYAYEGACFQLLTQAGDMDSIGRMEGETTVQTKDEQL